MSSNDICQHVLSVEDYTPVELEQWKNTGRCCDCSYHGDNLWLCLAKDCGKILCGDSQVDHSTIHFQNCRTHTVHQNLSTLRNWCYLCETEVFLYSSQQQQQPQHHVVRSWQDDNESTDSEENCHENRKPKGLQNIGNTCYMNAALQALCNTLPLTQYFLQCCVLNTSQDKKTCLSRNFQRLIQEMWQKNGPGYIVPSGILYGIRSVHPMFRGYQQHDTQEFLRCFMDQLHEELKEPVPETLCQRSNNSLITRLLSSEPSDEEEGSEEVRESGDGERGASSGSQSEAEYETCDSGVSERSSLSDDSEHVSMKRKHSSCSISSRCKLPSRGLGGYKSRPAQNVKCKRKPVKYKSIISEIFDGKLLSSVQCLTCNKVSTRIETFQDLSLPIPSRDHVTMLHQGTIAPQSMATCTDVYNGKPSWVSWLWEWMRSWFWGPTVSLHDCLAAFFSADELKGDNMYSCEKCTKLRNGVKYSKVLDLPEVLCIHLKRFRHELAFSSKISSYVSFPLTGLDMRPYLHKDCNSEVTSYDLSSIICHHGTAGGGHYTCYALSSANDEWYELDDQCVTQVSPETVANSEAYVLFYRKNNDKMKKVQSRVYELMRYSNREPSLMEFYVSKQWINRLNTFAEPGPIDNSYFLCVHGGVEHSKLQVVDKITTILSQTVWQYLYDTFGGGPACNRLYICAVCQQEQEALRRRTQYELTRYLTYSQEFQQEESPPLIFGLSMLWFRQWQAFVQNTTSEPPGPIDNTPIITNVNGVKTLKIGSDYAQLSEELWNFFKNIYGGGPELILKQLPRGPSRASFSSGISSEKEPSLTHQPCKAKSIESLPANMSSIGYASETVGRKSGRAHSASSDNIALKIAASIHNAHRKQQSLGNLRIDKNEQVVGINKSLNQREEAEEVNKETTEHLATQDDYRPAFTPERELDFDENEYCPAFTPDEIYSYVPFESCDKYGDDKRMQE